MSGHRILFYATRDDLAPVIGSVEAISPLRYALTGLHITSDFSTYPSALEIPRLGQATADSSSACDSYLAVHRDTQIVIREVPQVSGGSRFAIDQLANPNSVRFQSGGVCEGNILIHGLVDTTGVTEEALTIFNHFRKWLKKSFTRRGAFYVGAKALQLKEQGWRLTGAIRSPREYDLA